MMFVFHYIQRRIFGTIKNNSDLIILWVLLIAYQPHISVDSPLARPDLVPWLMFCLSGAVLLRGKTFGDGPHASLTKQVSAFGSYCRLAAMLLTPITLVYWFDLGVYLHLIIDGDETQRLGMPIVLSLAVALCLIMSSKHDRTAWNPPGMPSFILWGLGSIFILSAVVATGVLERMMPAIPTDALILGFAFLAVGSVVGRAKNYRQRRASGLKDGRSYWPKIFNYLFATVGSMIGLFALGWIQGRLGLGATFQFEQAFIPAAFVVAWAGVVWPKRIPIAVTCMLHEIMPAGGGDKPITTTASSFDQTPQGALRINPLRIKRVRATHPWLVPVKASRVPELDDPIRPLWPRREAPLAYHIMGNASFEPDPYTSKEQWAEITIRLKGSDDVGSLSGAAATNRSFVVLKPFLKPGTSRRRKIVTYRWDKPVPEGTIQAVDATTETLSLENGSIIVLATEGVARAFEVEIGSPVFQMTEASGFRPPQLEDYVKV